MGSSTKDKDRDGGDVFKGAGCSSAGRRRAGYGTRPKTDTALGQLVINPARCIAVPYNVETPALRPVPPATTTAHERHVRHSQYPVRRRLAIFSCGATRRQPLPKGSYWLYAAIDGVLEKITFPQTC